MKDADGTKYIHFSERQTKTRSGADPRFGMSDRSKLKLWRLQIYHEQDPVVAFEIYSEKRPESMNKPDAPFYLDVNHIAKIL